MKGVCRECGKKAWNCMAILCHGCRDSMRKSSFDKALTKIEKRKVKEALSVCRSRSTPIYINNKNGE